MQLIQTVHVTLDEYDRPIRSTEERFTFTDEVQRGSDLLDRLVPGWYRDLDLDALNLSSGYACVLGQLSMSRFREQLREKHLEDTGDSLPEGYTFDYEWVTRLLSDTEEDWDYDNDAPAFHGFYVSSETIHAFAKAVDELDDEGLSRQAWEDLTHEWAHFINRRFLADRRAELGVVWAAERVMAAPQRVEVEVEG